MKSIAIPLIVTTTLLAACSTETMKRTGYEMMKQRERQECLHNPRAECQEQPGYNEYEQMRRDTQ